MVKKTVMSGMWQPLGQKREKITHTKNTSGNDDRENSTMVV
jgi:hypothetical protein